MAGISLEEQVKSAVRSVVSEELSAQTGRSRPGTQLLVDRTRQLISVLASSASRSLNAALTTTPAVEIPVEETQCYTKLRGQTVFHLIVFALKRKVSRLRQQRKRKSFL